MLSKRSTPFKTGNQDQIPWINCAKFLAIFGVILDHSYGFLYTDSKIGYLSWFSMPLFILLSGMTSYLSGEKYVECGWYRCFWRKSKRILGAYLVASFIYLIWDTHFFDLRTYLEELIHFNASPPFYFVALYLQLMVVFYPLNLLLRKIPRGGKWLLAEVGLVGLFLAISIFSIQRTNILDIAGGGGKLFGGTFLLLFYVGMIVAKHEWFSEGSWIRALICMIAFGIAWVILWRTLCATHLSIEEHFPFGLGKNPPGVTLMLYGICAWGFCFGFFTLLEKNKGTAKVVDVINWLGQQTLTIFFYHFLILAILKENEFLLTSDPWVRWIVGYPVIIGGSLLIGAVLSKIAHGWKLFCQYRGKEA